MIFLSDRLKLGRLKNCILLFLWAVMIDTVWSQCKNHQHFTSAGCIECNNLRAGCGTCDEDYCFSCRDNLVPRPIVSTALMPGGTKDGKGVYCIFQEKDCHVITGIPTTSGCQNCVENTDNAATFAEIEALGKVDSAVCKAAITDCPIDFGCQVAIQDLTSISTSSDSKVGGSGAATGMFCFASDCGVICANTTFCGYRDSKTFVTGDACTDTNCLLCPSAVGTCDACKAGYTLSGGSCAASRRLLVSEDEVEIQDLFETENFGETTEGVRRNLAVTGCPDNCAKCADASTCTHCDSGYILSSTGTCVSSCQSGESLLLQRVFPPVQELFLKYYCAAATCDSTCSSCSNNDSGADKCTSCPSGKYLSISDKATLSGTCVSKAPKGDSNEIVIYVSNLAADIARNPALQTGDVGTPFTSLRRAIKASASLATPYTKNADGTMVTVRILLLPGDHYIIEEDISADVLLDDIPNVDTFNPRNIPPFKLIITSSDGTVVNIYNNIGQDFTAFFPSNLVMENLNFDFLNSVIDKTEDSGNCRKTRGKCCEIISLEGGTMNCTYTRPIKPPIYFLSYNHMFYLINVDTSALSFPDPPELKLTKVTFQNFMFDAKSIFFFGDITDLPTKVTVTEIEVINWNTYANLFGNHIYEHVIASSLSDYRNKFTELAREKPALSDGTTHACASAQNCGYFSITKSNFHDYYYFSGVAEGFQFVHVINIDIPNYPLAMVLNLQNTTKSNPPSGTILFDSNTFSKINSKRMHGGSTCSYSTYFKYDGLRAEQIGDGIATVQGNFDTFITNNVVTEVSVTATIWHQQEVAPKLVPNGIDTFEKKFIFAGNSFTNVSNFDYSHKVILDLLKVPYTTTLEKDAQIIPCTHVVFDRNQYKFVASTYINTGTNSITCKGMLIDESHHNVSFDGSPEITFTIEGVRY